MSDHQTCDCSRRSFLRGSGLTLAGFGLSSLLPGAWIRHALAAGPFSNKRLMFIFLRGGNDGINTVIPNGDPQYSVANRPSLYIPPASSIDLLNGFARLHPSMADVMDVFNSGDLAIVHRVGFPNNSRSHFDDQRVWENGNPSTPKMFEGWLYRYVIENAVAQGVDLPALSVQGTPPVLLRGDVKFVNVANPDSFDYLPSEPKKTKIKNAWLDRFTNLTGLEPYRPALTDTGIKLVDTLDEYRAWDQRNWHPKDPNTGFYLFPVSDLTNPPGPTGPRFGTNSYSFFKALKVCALSLLESDATSPNGTRLAGTELGTFDTHNNQGQATGSQATLLSWLAYGLRSLQILLSGAATYDPGQERTYPAIWQDTMVVTLSEFGRTSKENGSFGSDHAAASCLFAAGGAVNGGVYNCDPGTWPAGVMLADAGRYLLMRTDYRAIFWEILRDHMGADPAKVDAVFPGYSGLGLQEVGLVG